MDKPKKSKARAKWRVVVAGEFHPLFVVADDIAAAAAIAVKRARSKTVTAITLEVVRVTRGEDIVI